jgi:hypothetical protein
MVEEPDDVGEVDTAVAVVVEQRCRLVRGNPGHLVEVEHDVREVGPAVPVDVIVLPVVVGIRREPGAAGARDGELGAIDRGPGVGGEER